MSWSFYYKKYSFPLLLTTVRKCLLECTKYFFKLLLLKKDTKKLKNWTKDIHQSLNATHLLHKLVHSVEEESGTLLAS